ncbi:hypothetical protein ACO0LF_27100 [Undibacterium sp. Di27W]|uniref:hypothetical protein n=1 Tax=Undibacterium sp. Di27W TaxID=3413036 RepID=UPI003BF2B6A7
MTFQFKNLDGGELQGYAKRVYGPVYALQSCGVVDDERDIIFLDLGGHGDLAPGRGECPTYYNLLWQGMAVAFEGYDALQRSGDGVTLIFTITKFVVPPELAQMTEEIKAALVAASQCYWNGRYKRELLFDVRFNS